MLSTIFIFTSKPLDTYQQISTAINSLSHKKNYLRFTIMFTHYNVQGGRYQVPLLMPAEHLHIGGRNTGFWYACQQTWEVLDPGKLRGGSYCRVDNWMIAAGYNTDIAFVYEFPKTDRVEVALSTTCFVIFREFPIFESTETIFESQNFANVINSFQALHVHKYLGQVTATPCDWWQPSSYPSKPHITLHQ